MNWLVKIGYAFWLRLRAILKKVFSQQGGPTGLLFLKGAKTPLPFFTGTNLPWLHYGGDFGANFWSPNGGVAQPEKRQLLGQLFRDLKERGITVIRWFLLCDGRAGIRYTSGGRPGGPDLHLFADIDAALEQAAASGLQVIFVLLDFLWFGEAAMVNGVQIRGRSDIIAERRKQGALRRRVLRPLLKRYGRSPVILAWDIVNEPEWATKGCDAAFPTALPFVAMRRFLKKTARLIRRHTKQLVTVGLANAAGLPLVREIGLDFYQVHWYDRWEIIAPLERPVPELDLGRPVLLGEFPTKNSARAPEWIVAAARKSGYCGALAWSLLGSDRSSGMGSEEDGAERG